MGTDDAALDPSSISWRVNREAVLLLGGRRALLMQLAHPLVAQAVADHSRFARDRIGRLLRTLRLSFAVVFGEPGQADEAIEHINSVHRNVTGRLPQEAGCYPEGTPYCAQDPDLLLWVHATLVDSALAFYQRFVEILDEDERERFYFETARTTPSIGIPADLLPDGYPEFRRYVEEMLAERLAVTDTARALAGEILYPPGGWVIRRVFDPLNIVTVGTLPETLRDAYGLKWNRRRQAAFDGVTAIIRQAVAIAPARLRVVPQAMSAERRLASGAR